MWPLEKFLEGAWGQKIGGVLDCILIFKSFYKNKIVKSGYVVYLLFYFLKLVQMSLKNTQKLIYQKLSYGKNVLFFGKKIII